MFNLNRDNYRCHVRSLPPRPVWVRVWAGIEWVLVFCMVAGGAAISVLIAGARLAVRWMLGLGDVDND